MADRLNPDRACPVRGDLLRHFRRAQALTQRELAERAGVSERAIRKAEKGGVVRGETVQRIARALRVPPNALQASADAASPRPSMAEKGAHFLRQVWNHGDLSVIDSLLRPEFVFHHEAGTVHNRDEMRQRILAFRQSFSDFDFVIEQIAQHGSLVVCHWQVTMTHTGRWLDLEPTGRTATVYGSSWVQVVGDQFGDAWDFWDPQHLYQQLCDPPQDDGANDEQ